MKVTVHLFSHVRHQLGQDVLELELEDESDSDVVEALVRERLPAATRDQPFRLARNHTFLTEPQCLKDGDELAVLPPMQGG